MASNGTRADEIGTWTPKVGSIEASAPPQGPAAADFYDGRWNAWSDGCWLGWYATSQEALAAARREYARWDEYGDVWPDDEETSDA